MNIVPNYFIKSRTLISILSLSLLVGCGVNTNPGTGTRNGQIVMLKREGLLSKTWECEILKGGMSNGSGSFGQPFYFTVQSDSDAIELQKLMDDQKEVIIKYHTEGIYSAFRSSSGGDFLDYYSTVTNSSR